VFLDINMPGVDGFKVLAYLSCESRLAKGPVIIDTSYDQPQTSKRALDEGAKAETINPAMADILEKVLKKAGII
jgi:CheY-like chemotaxis protein